MVLQECYGFLNLSVSWVLGLRFRAGKVECKVLGFRGIGSQILHPSLHKAVSWPPGRRGRLQSHKTKNRNLKENQHHAAFGFLNKLYCNISKNPVYNYKPPVSVATTTAWHLRHPRTVAQKTVPIGF